MAQERANALVDAGAPKFAAQCGLGDRFRYWQGSSGRRYLFTAMPCAEIGDIGEAVVIIARGDGDAGFHGLDVCAPGDPGEPEIADVAADLSANSGLIAFVHLLAGNGCERHAIVRDFTAAEQRLAA